MSIAVLTQVYDEVRRLAIAGSVVAGGDFRLKKLIAPLEQAGAKAPVFAKAAQATKALVESNEQTSAQALLELTTLVNAVLYTQGETGLAGELQPLETTDLGVQTTQASARTLKPLLEALTTTGSGRLEIIREAHTRGAFRDLRLIKPSLDALNDVYPDIAQFIGTTVLPLYGKAILPQLKATFDLKGKGSHVRRLALMHQLDPAGTRPLVKEGFEVGSKEIRIAAIECLGDEPEDLKLLLEQASAKSKDVRGAALTSLAKLESEEALDVLKKSLSGADIGLVTWPLQKNRNPKLLKFVLDEAQREFDELLSKSDPKAVAKSVDRFNSLLICLMHRNDQATEAFLLRTFDRRSELLKVKVEDVGAVIVGSITDLMATCSATSQHALIDAHPTLEPDILVKAFQAACRSLPQTKVFDEFSPYLTAKVDEKKKTKNPALSKRDAISRTIAYEWSWYREYNSDKPALKWDPRWLDIAVDMKHLYLINALATPGHAGANKLLSESFEALFKKSKGLGDLQDFSEILETMIRIQHPESTDRVIQILMKYAGPKMKHLSGVYWVGRLISGLPKSATAKIEEVLPTLHEDVKEILIEYIAALGSKV